MIRKCSLPMRSPLGCAAGASSACRTVVGVIDQVCQFSTLPAGLGFEGGKCIGQSRAEGGNRNDWSGAQGRNVVACAQCTAGLYPCRLLGPTRLLQKLA